MRLIIAVVLALLPAAAWAECNRYIHEIDDQWVLFDQGIQIFEHREGRITHYNTGGAGTGIPFRAALPGEGHPDASESHYRHVTVNGQKAMLWNMMFFYQDCR